MNTSPLGIAIVGAGHTPFGSLTMNLEQMIIEAARGAIEDSGIDPADIDLLVLGHFNAGMVPDAFAASLIQQADPALQFKPAARAENACASGAAAIHAGMNAILSGRARHVLVVGAEKMTGCNTAEVTQALAGAGYQNDAAEARMTFPQLFALSAQQYAERYGNPLDAMARIAAKNHANAMANPLAHMQRPLDFEACNTVGDKNPLIAPPLRLTDCSLISDGAAAIVLTGADNAKAFARRVAVRSASHINDSLPLHGRDFLAFEGPKRAIADALQGAGMTLEDLDFAEVHDCFTIAELLIYEAMGLTKPGKGHEAIESGLVARGGKLPVNLSGGLKAKGHPVGATGVSMHAIAYRQLTDRAGDMQLDGAEAALVFNMGGAAVANYASVLEAV